MREAGDVRLLPCDDDVVGVERAVGDASRSESVDLDPQVGQGFAVDSRGVEISEGTAADEPLHLERESATHPGPDQLGHSDPGRPGRQQAIRLMLDLMRPGQVKALNAVAVVHEPPQPVEQCDARFVPSDHSNADRTIGVGGHHHRLIGRLPWGQPDVPHGHAESTEGFLHLRGRRSSRRRADGQVNSRRHAPAQHQPASDVVRRGHAQVDGRRGQDGTEQLTEAPGRALEVRPSDDQQGLDHCQPHQGKGWRCGGAEYIRPFGDAAPVRDPHQPRQNPGQAAGQGQVPGQSPPPERQRGDDQHRHRPYSAKPVQRAEECMQPGGQRREGLGHGHFGPGGLPYAEPDQHDDGDRYSRPIARPATVRVLPWRSGFRFGDQPETRGDGMSESAVACAGSLFGRGRRRQLHGQIVAERPEPHEEPSPDPQPTGSAHATESR